MINNENKNIDDSGCGRRKKLGQTVIENDEQDWGASKGKLVPDRAMRCKVYRSSTFSSGCGTVQTGFATPLSFVITFIANGKLLFLLINLLE